MAASRKSVRAVGMLMSTAVLAISGLLVVKPVYDDVTENQKELSSLEVVTDSKQSQLTVLEGGVSNYEEIRGYVDQFLGKVPPFKDIESASRAISTAAVPGVKIYSFTFGTEENIDEYPIPAPNLQEYVPPAGFDSTVVAAEDEEPTAVDTYHRVPVEISVSASDYNTLSLYLNNLSQQDRLLTVLSVNSTREGSADGKSSSISATIYAYAFVYAR